MSLDARRRTGRGSLRTPLPAPRTRGHIGG